MVRRAGAAFVGGIAARVRLVTSTIGGFASDSVAAISLKLVALSEAIDVGDIVRLLTTIIRRVHGEFEETATGASGRVTIAGLGGASVSLDEDTAVPAIGDGDGLRSTGLQCTRLSSGVCVTLGAGREVDAADNDGVDALFAVVVHFQSMASVGNACHGRDEEGRADEHIELMVGRRDGVLETSREL